MNQLFPVILSGGSGTRLWPLSRTALPKQFLALRGNKTMLQETAGRVRLPNTAPPLVICNEEHRFLVAEQMRSAGIRPTSVVLEPVARNTAPAAAIAALTVSEQDPDGVILLQPSDHFIDDDGRFNTAVECALKAAAEGGLVTFGIRPLSPETGYGYIKRGRAQSDEAFAVDSFVEKPDNQTAAKYLADGSYYWNSGIFAFRANVLLAELSRLAPAVLDAAKQAFAAATRDLDFIRLDKDQFSASPNVSIDYAIMEKTKNAVVVPADMAWSDVGSWSALWDVSAKDDDGNVLQGDVLTHGTSGCLARAERGLTALVGVKDLAVVITDDVVLVADRNSAQDVKQIVETLRSGGRTEHQHHAIVYRPWGSYQTVNRGPRHQVKHIIVKPGGRLSLQLHHQRAEHWTVVEGQGQVTCGDRVFTLKENESTFIPLGTRHRLENLGASPLHLIEVQSGDYLGEDDIVRLEDIYGRAPAAKV